MISSKNVVSGWEDFKATVDHQWYSVPREKGMAELESDVVTWVAGKEAV